MGVKHGLFLFLLTFACFVAHGTATRDLLMKSAEYDLVGSCLNFLMELKSCSNEIVLFFTNGTTTTTQADIGPNCCCAITAITHNCWLGIITSLGFTPQDGHYLRDYCDASASSPALAPAV